MIFRCNLKLAPGLKIVELVPAQLGNQAGMMGVISLLEKQKECIAQPHQEG